MSQAATGGGPAAAGVAYTSKVATIMTKMEEADPSGEGLAEFARLLNGSTRAPVPMKDGQFQVDSMDALWRIATAVWAGGIVPAGIKSKEALFVCLSYGLEAGLSITQSLRGVMVVNNIPSVWGDMALGLVRGSGLCEWIKEWEEDVEGEGLTAFCQSKRKGEADPVLRKWSQRDNETARLQDKPIHKQYPARMRQVRARAFLLRDLYADVLGGLAIAEEQMDVDPLGPVVGGAPAVAEREAEDLRLAAAARELRVKEEREAAERDAREREALAAIAEGQKKPEPAEPKANGSGKSKGDAGAVPPAAEDGEPKLNVDTASALAASRERRAKGKAQPELLDPG
jgi:hypothetical protein